MIIPYKTSAEPIENYVALIIGSQCLMVGTSNFTTPSAIFGQLLLNDFAIRAMITNNYQLPVSVLLLDL